MTHRGSATGHSAGHFALLICWNIQLEARKSAYWCLVFVRCSPFIQQAPQEMHEADWQVDVCSTDKLPAMSATDNPNQSSTLHCRVLQLCANETEQGGMLMHAGSD